MAVRIRLSRFGKKDKPSYRFVVMDSTQKRDGKVLDTLGMYDPTTPKSTSFVDKKKLDTWLSHGAKPTESVAKILHL